MDATLLVCPVCRTTLSDSASALECAACKKRYPKRADWTDFLPEDNESSRGLAPALMHLPRFASIYENYWRPAFMTALGRGQVSREQELTWLASSLAPAEGGVVVDLSCGPGVIGRRLAASRRYREVLGVDLSEAMLTQCARLCRDEGLTMPLLRADAHLLPFADRSVSAVHAGAALHLWERPHEVLAEIARVLVPGGVLVASTLRHAGKPWERAAADLLQWSTKTRLFEDATLRNMLGSAGFTAIETWLAPGLIMVQGQMPAAAA